MSRAPVTERASRSNVDTTSFSPARTAASARAGRGSGRSAQTRCRFTRRPRQGIPTPRAARRELERRWSSGHSQCGGLLSVKCRKSPHQRQTIIPPYRHIVFPAEEGARGGNKRSLNDPQKYSPRSFAHRSQMTLVRDVPAARCTQCIAAAGATDLAGRSESCHPLHYGRLAPTRKSRHELLRSAEARAKSLFPCESPVCDCFVASRRKGIRKK